MNGNELKAMWKSGKPSIGVWLTGSNQAVARILSNVGFDWIFLDWNYRFNSETMRNLLFMLRDRNTPAIVRVEEIDETLIKRLLDWGATGLLFPSVNFAANARRAVRVCRASASKERPIVIAQIDDCKGVQHLDTILKVPGLDALMIEPHIMSYTFNLMQQVVDGHVREAICATINKARAAGMPVGMTWRDSDEGYAEYVLQGLSWITPSANIDFLSIKGKLLTIAASNWLTKMRGLVSGRMGSRASQSYRILME